MDFLDSIDLESTCRKSHRVRSWYLYEQYKSLEKIQMDAVAKLRDRSYQDRLLHRELRERRARRRLCGELRAGAVSHSENGLDHVHSDVRSCVTASNNDFFESFCEIQDEEISPRSDLDHDTDGTSTQGDHDHDCRPYVDELKSTENDDEELKQSSNPSFDSVIAKMNPVNSIVFHANISSNLADDIKQELEFVKKTIAENIDMQLETVKENMQCLEEYSKFREDSNKFDENSLNNEDKSSKKLSKQSSRCGYEYDDESICSIQPCALPAKHDNEYNNNVYTLWSKLVSFAYQVIQLNHGNCYYDYSSQFLTAVLACDVLRRGVNRMCHILQPYVSPIKYASEDTVSINTRSVKIQKPVKRKLSSILKESKKIFGPKCKPKHCKPSRGVKISNVKSPSISRSYGDKKYHSENNWRQYSTGSRVDGNKIRLASEPWRSLTACPSILQYSDKYPSTIWPEEFSRYSDEEFWSCHTRVVNPMLKLATYIDSVIKNIGDYNV